MKWDNARILLLNEILSENINESRENFRIKKIRNVEINFKTTDVESETYHRFIFI